MLKPLRPVKGQSVPCPTTVVALAVDPLARAELGAFLDGLELLVLAELAPDDLDGFLEGSNEPYALVWEVDGTDALVGPLPDVPLLALVSSPLFSRHLNPTLTSRATSATT